MQARHFTSSLDSCARGVGPRYGSKSQREADKVEHQQQFDFLPSELCSLTLGKNAATTQREGRTGRRRDPNTTAVLLPAFLSLIPLLDHQSTTKEGRDDKHYLPRLEARWLSFQLRNLSDSSDLQWKAKAKLVPDKNAGHERVRTSQLNK